MFSSLADGCLKFSAGKFKNLASSRFGQAMPEGYLLHNDIKTENVLLGSNKTKDGSRKWYPIPKFADFGLSIITTPFEALRNQARFLQKGTKAWYPPEQRCAFMQDYKRHYFQQPGSSSLRRDQHKILASANVWAIGAIMWSMITLDEIDNLSDRVNDILMGTASARRTFDGKNVVKRFDPTVRSRYSLELLGLVQACLRIRPEDRPLPQTLCRDVERNLHECRNREIRLMDTEGHRDRLSVACAPGEMEKLPGGGADFERNDAFWQSFAAHLLWVPKDWAMPCPPKPPQTLPMNPNWPEALRERVQERWAAAARARGVHAPVTSPRSMQARKRTASAAFAEDRRPVSRDDQDEPNRKRQQIRNTHRRT